jgi:hypothetical protein
VTMAGALDTPGSVKMRRKEAWWREVSGVALKASVMHSSNF